MSISTLIYALHDPTDRSRRVYVGKTIDPRRRYAQHCNPRRPIGMHGHWLRKMLARGVRPEMVTLEVVPADGDWQEAQRFWIESLRAMGLPLTNYTLGGEGAIGYRHSSRARATISAKAKGRGKGVPKSLEHKAKIAAARKGRRPAPGTLAAVRRIAEERRGKPMEWTRGRRSDVARRRMAEAKASLPPKSLTGFKGVITRPSGRFEAAIWSGRNVRLGTFGTAEEAARAYDAAAIQKYGPSAWLNFPNDHHLARRG